MNWDGVFPAIFTPFTKDLAVDHERLGAHVNTLIDAGCTGLVPLGSLGEAATLTETVAFASLPGSRKRNIVRPC